MALDYTRAIALGLLDPGPRSVPHMLNILNEEVGPYGFYLSCPKGHYGLEQYMTPSGLSMGFGALSCKDVKFSLRRGTFWVTKPEDLTTKLREVLTIIGEMPKEG